MNPDISIIIPVYNVEKYLRRCLDSCVNQTYKNIEIIVVNDFSPDKSDEIMREYESKYPDLIRCIYLKKNIKQGGARNLGIKLSKGKYLLFVDSDDWIEKSMCEILMRSVLMNNPDMVIFDYCDIRNDVSNIRKSTKLKSSQQNIDFNDLTTKTAVCIRLIRKDIIINNNLFFPENMSYEDVAIVPIWTAYSKVINYECFALYNYWRHSSSTTTKWSNEIVSNHIDAFELLLDKISNMHLSTDNYFKNLLFELLKYTLLDAVLIGNTFNISLENLKQRVYLAFSNVVDTIDEVDNLTIYEKRFITCFFKTNDYCLKLWGRELLDLEKYCLWGYSWKCEQLLSYLKSHGTTPISIVDNNASIIPIETIHGISIVEPNKISNDIKWIIITVNEEKNYNEICEQIRKMNLNVEIRHYLEILTV